MKNFVSSINREKIPIDISQDEIILRVLFDPSFYNKKKDSLTRKAFWPKATGDDEEQRRRVSVMRRQYSTDTDCKKSSRAIRMNGDYVGFVSFMGVHIEHVNKLKYGVTASLEFTPLDKKGNYIHSKLAYVNQPGSPMHAELVYDFPLIPNDPNPSHRLFAEELATLLKDSVHLDPEPGSTSWLGGAMVCTSP
ncbi:MAG: hypothetical protein ACO1NS_02080 [Daejeonella sp.]